MQALCNQIKHRARKYQKTNTIRFEADEKKALLSVQPSRLEFTFQSEDFKVQEKIIEVSNYFPNACPVQLLPLETQYFRIGKNVPRRKWLNPGSVFKIIVSFLPDENRDYNDVLSIRYFNEQFIQIKIFAQILPIFSFPTTVNFGDVPLGQPVCCKLPICSHKKKEFSFAILPCKESPCIDIYPRWGNVKPGGEPSIVIVVYRPLRYICMHFQIRIFVSDLCKTPYVINFYAYTRPGLLRETIENVIPKIESKKPEKIVGTRTPKEMKTISLKKDTSYAKDTIVKHPGFKNTLLDKYGHLQLYSLHATNCILNLKTRRSFDEYELIGPLGTNLYRMIDQKAQDRKEFLIAIENRRRENERTRFHHKPKINNDISENQIIKIKILRQQAWDEYSMLLNPQKELFEREEAKKLKQRILRVPHKYPDAIWTSSEEESFLRYCKIKPFLQAARKVVLRNRLLKILEKLRNVDRTNDVVALDAAKTWEDMVPPFNAVNIVK